MIRTLRTVVTGSEAPCVAELAELERNARDAITKALDYRKAVAVSEPIYVGVHQEPLLFSDGTEYRGPDNWTLHAFEVQAETAS